MKFKHSKIQKQNAKNMRNNPAPAEAILWLYLRKSGLNGLKFRRQQPVGKYVVDFLCCSKKIIIELDGGQHSESQEYDKIRDEFLVQEGYKVIRIWNNQIFDNIEGVMEYINTFIESPTRKSEISTLPSREGSDTISPYRAGEIKIQCPAKINLNLKVTGRRDDGFHNIESVMQTISLYDYLTIKTEPAENFEIILSGNNAEIPYNEKNLVYKAAILFIEKTNLPPHKIDIYIDKNIPVAAGLAGGSTDAAGTLFGLNELFNIPLSKTELHTLCAQLGSDLNFCLEGGRQMTKGRGEILEKMPFENMKISLIKPKCLGISAKEAYTKFSQKKSSNFKSEYGSRYDFKNDLEWALIDDYEELQKIKNLYPDSIMSGSGSTYFMVNETFKPIEDYWIKNDLQAIEKGAGKVPLL